MSRDIAILKRVNFPSFTEGERLNVGNTDFSFATYDNDFQFTSGKQLRVVEGTNKIIQGILKVLLTQRGTSLEDQSYGAELDAGIGSKMQQENYADLRDSVYSAIEYYMLLNDNSENPDEIITEIEEVKAVRDDEDPRMILVYVSVITQSGKRVSVTVPQVQ